ncbi:MAG: hypothetical protein H6608_09860 [Flavobacteriales bacterium]|nr:hypothetical protein [Bacteroidota bacterium]MCB9241427.1 hypothetical protein [Flavobacteriales bacterium]
MRNSVVIVAVVLVLAGLIYWMSSPGTQPSEKRFSWAPSYWYDQGKMPYDIDVFIDLIKHEVHEDSFTRLRAPFSTYQPQSAGGLYVAVCEDFSRDYHESYALIEFISAGNTGFVAAENLEYTFLDALSLESDLDTCTTIDQSLISIPGAGDSVNVRLVGTSVQTNVRTGLRAPQWRPFQSFNKACIDRSLLEEVIRDKHGNLIGVKLTIDSGELYLVSMPLMLANFNMIHESNFAFVNELMKRMTFNKVYWDLVGFEHSNGSKNDKTPFTELFKNRSLRTAFYVLIFGVLVFIAFAIQRFQPAIPLYRPPQNASVNFSKSVARMYWLHPNHKRIAQKRIQFFLSEVRSRYGLDTTNDSEEFRIKLAKKTGLEIRHINRLMDAAKVVNSNREVHEQLLLQISESVSYIRQHWK